jgi:hypothetical protein
MFFSSDEKIRKKIIAVIEKNIPKKFTKISDYFKDQNENNITIFENVVNDILDSKPNLHSNVGDLFYYFLLGNRPVLFQLFFESIVGNKKLYDFLQNHLGYKDEDQFYGFLLQKAENHTDKEASNFALGILIVLYDTFGMTGENKR